MNEKKMFVPCENCKLDTNDNRDMLVILNERREEKKHYLQKQNEKKTN